MAAAEQSAAAFLLPSNTAHPKHTGTYTGPVLHPALFDFAFSLLTLLLSRSSRLCQYRSTRPTNRSTLNFYHSMKNT
jgi:hypothetical protein